MKMKNKKGFTLIELIVVITIIAVLTVAGVISFGGASKRARDSRRMADLEKIRIGLELYRQGMGVSYPATLNVLVPTYLQAVPVGPRGVAIGDTYSYSHSGYTYTLRTTLEETGIGYSVTNP